MQQTGLIQTIANLLDHGAQRSTVSTAGISGVIVAFVANLINNLPAGLIAGSAAQTADASDQVTRCLLIGVDLGPNLSVTGSLATILWLTALRREGYAVSLGAFLKLGIVVMPPALLLAIGAALLFG